MSDLFDSPVPLPVAQEITDETDIVAIGGRVTPGALLASYRAGRFPMAIRVEDDEESDRYATAWFAPAQRAVLRYPGSHVSRSLRRSMRRFRITYDTDFDGVLAGCADPARPHAWITDDYRAVYRELFARGEAHSVEVWRGDVLAGGLLGVSMGGLFCADTMFHRITDASKAAVAGLSARVFDGAAGGARMIEAQWLTDHLATLGFVELPRATYEAELPRLLALPPPFPKVPRPQ